MNGFLFTGSLQWVSKHPWWLKSEFACSPVLLELDFLLWMNSLFFLFCLSARIVWQVTGTAVTTPVCMILLRHCCLIVFHLQPIVLQWFYDNFLDITNKKRNISLIMPCVAEMSSKIVHNGIETIPAVTYQGWEPGKEYTKNIVLKNVKVKTQKITYKWVNFFKLTTTMHFSIFFIVSLRWPRWHLLSVL